MKNFILESIFVKHDINIGEDSLNFIIETLDKIAYGSIIITMDKGHISKIEREEKFRLK
ncbi:DUF2292 domain-containing protein [Clostridium nigeriense]